MNPIRDFDVLKEHFLNADCRKSYQSTQTFFFQPIIVNGMFKWQIINWNVFDLILTQEAATSTQSPSSDSNDSSDEKMMITIAGEDQDVADNSN